MSLYENIALGDPAVTREACAALLERLGLREWLETLPGGLDATVEEESANLSGGQGQLLAVARALAARAPVLLLDEPFSALDPQREARLRRLLEAESRERLVLLTSHRASSLAGCAVIRLAQPAGCVPPEYPEYKV